MRLTPHRTRPRTRPCRRRTSAVLLASAVSVCLLAASAPVVPLGVGDRLFPYLGNPGYDVASYDLSFTYPGSNSQPLRAVTTIDAWTTADLERINLDFAHGTVHSVEVDGEPARLQHRRRGPGDHARGLRARTATGCGSPCGTPATPSPPGGARAAGCAPRTASPWPTRPTPRTWCSRATTTPPTRRCSPSGSPPPTVTRSWRTACPPGWTSPAGRPRGRTAPSTPWPPNSPRCPSAAPRCCTVPARTDCRYGTSSRPGTARRSNPGWRRPRSRSPGWRARSAATPSRRTACSWPTPPPASQLETQTLSLFERELFTEPAHPAWYVESIMIHELAHQWFGDSVSPRTWSDLWLNEGHATWYEALYAEEQAGKPLRDRMKAAYGASDGWRVAGGPPAAPQGPRARPQDRHLPAERLRRRRARPVRPAPGDRPRGLRTPGARLGRPVTRTAPPRRTTSSGSPPRSPGAIWTGFFERLAVRGEDPADARAPGRGGTGRAGETGRRRRERGLAGPRIDRAADSNNTVTRRAVPCDYRQVRAAREHRESPGIPVR
ncbi:hypothetical protein SVIOM74S_09593 [Streptomyces violarus]